MPSISIYATARSHALYRQGHEIAGEKLLPSRIKCIYNIVVGGDVRKRSAYSFLHTLPLGTDLELH